MKEYEALNWFLFRKPFLSYKQFEDLTRSDENLLASINDPFIKEILSSSSPDLLREILHAKSLGKIPPELKQSLFNTLTRMTFRSVPFGSFAGVGIGEISEKRTTEEPTIEMAEELNFLRSFTQKNSARKGKQVVLNPTAFFDRGIAKFVVPKDKDNREKFFYKYSFVSFPEELIRAVKEDPDQLPEKLKNHLLKLNLLLPVQKPEEKVIVKTLGQSLKDEEDLNTHTHNIEMFIPSYESNISKTIADDVQIAAEVFLRLHNPATNKLDTIKNAFISKYEAEEVPLLELIDPDNFIGHIFQKSLETGADYLEAKTQQQYLRELLETEEVKQSGRLILDQKEIEKLTIQKKSFPDSFAAVFELIEIPGGKHKIFLKHLKGPHAVGHFARYLKLNKRLHQNVKQLITKEKNLYSNAIMAEVIHHSDLLKARDVMPVTNLYEACIPVSSTTQESSSTVINLSDIGVFYDFRNDRFRLRSKSLNREIRPVLTNLYNTEIDSHPVFRFLTYIELQGSFPLISWSWQKFNDLGYFPRIEYKNTILSPASWPITSENIRSIKALKNNAESIREFFKKKNWPLDFELVSRFVRLKFNLNIDHSLASFARSIKETESYRIIEQYLPLNLFKDQGRHSHDIIIPFVRTVPLPSIDEHYHFSNRKEVSRKVTVFPPGSEWTYIELYMPRSHADRFISKHLKGLMRKTKAKWFFIKYANPEFHIRLRVHGTDGSEVLKFAEKAFNKNLCSQYAIKTYRREIERYGGLKGCKIFESLSQSDSEAAIRYAELLQGSSLSSLEMWLFAAIISAETYLDSFGISHREAIELLISRKNSTLKNGTAQKILTTYKKIVFGETKSTPSEILQLRKIYSERASKQKAEIVKLLKLYDRNEIYVSRNSFILSLIHLSLIRLDLEFDVEYEEKVLQTVREIMQMKSRSNK